MALILSTIDDLQPDLDQSARFVQIYFLDNGKQTICCIEVFNDLHHDIVNNIQEVLKSINALIF